MILRSNAVRPVFDIIHIELNHSLVIHLAPPADLPGTSKAGHHFKATCISLGIEDHELIAVAKLKRPRAQPSSSHRRGR